MPKHDDGAQPDNPKAVIHDEASWGQGERGAEGDNASGRSEIHPTTNLTEEAVGQHDEQLQNSPLDPSLPHSSREGTENRAGELGGQQRQGQQPAGQGDPNREPGGEGLYNRDEQGNVFYDKNTEIRRESQFHDATAAPLGPDAGGRKVNQDDDLFGKEKKE